MPSDEPSEQPRPRLAARTERLMLAAAGLLGLCAIVIFIGLVNLGRAHDGVMLDVQRTREARLAAYNFMQASIDAETGTRGYLLTNDESFLEPYVSGRSAAFGHLAELRRLMRDEPPLIPQVDQADRLAHRAFDQLATLQAERTVNRAAFREDLQQSKEVMDALRAQVGVLLRELEALIVSRRAEEERSRDTIYWVGGTLSLLTLLAVVLTILALRSERRSWSAALAASRQAQRAAETARVKATESDLAKTRFLAVASHDMRQPLHALTLYLSALERRVQGEEARDILQKMSRATQSMVGMFASLLDLARIDAGVVAPEIEVFALQEVIDRVVAEHPSGVSATPTALSVRSDPVLLERALRNLVTNAIKHGGGRGRISATARGGFAEIAIDDYGPGVPMEEHERIFGEFVRLDTRREGLGLGLAIVKRIADMLGAEVRVEDAPGRGARFVIAAPLAQARAEESQEHAEARLDGAPVIVMDDDELAREAIAGAMRDMGAVVHACANGADVARALDAGLHPKLLVMDLRIDGELRGVDIAKTARARLNPAPPTLILTGDTEPQTLAKLRASGFAWLIKPVDPRALNQAAARELANGS